MKITEYSQKDNQGREYLHLCYNEDMDSVVTFRGINFSFKGRPELFIRNGKSSYNEQIVFEFRIKELLQCYDVNSNTQEEMIEVYFPKNKDTLNYFKSIVKFLEKNGI